MSFCRFTKDTWLQKHITKTLKGKYIGVVHLDIWSCFTVITNGFIQSVSYKASYKYLMFYDQLLAVEI